jgi:hypothetical protein
MNAYYGDILERIAEKPKWWDENAVPRFCDFSPDQVANIYADEVALVEIRCQCCETPFLVAFSYRDIEAHEMFGGRRSLAERIKDRSLHYGDPPRTGCCLGGDTMNSEPHRVLQYWKKAGFREWEHAIDLEVDIRPDWVME